MGLRLLGACRGVGWAGLAGGATCTCSISRARRCWGWRERISRRDPGGYDLGGVGGPWGAVETGAAVSEVRTTVAVGVMSVVATEAFVWRSVGATTEAFVCMSVPAGEMMGT